MLSAHPPITRPSDKGLLGVCRSMLCRHQWDMSRSRKGTFVCRACGARKT